MFIAADHASCQCRLGADKLSTYELGIDTTTVTFPVFNALSRWERFMTNTLRPSVARVHRKMICTQISKD